MTLRAEVAPSRRMLAVAVALVAANVVLLLLIAEDVVDGGGLISRDPAVLDWFVDNRTDWMVSAARFVSTVGGFVPWFVIGLLRGFWLWKRGAHWALAVAPVVSLSLGGLAASLGKAAFDRPRPPVSDHAASVASAAFPSGHATDAAAFFLAASFVIGITVARHRSTQALLVLVAAFLAGLVGISRLVLGVHWLSDVIAGWALGTATAITVVVAVWWLITPAPTDRSQTAPT